MTDVSNNTKKDPFAIGSGVPEIEGALRPQPKAADRISSKVIFITFGVVALMAGLFLAALDQMDNRKVTQPSELSDSPAKPATTTRNPIDGDVLGSGDNGKTSDKKESPSLATPKPAADESDLGKLTGAAPQEKWTPALERGQRIPETGEGRGTGVPPMGAAPDGRSLGGGSPAPLTPEQQAVAQAKQERQQRLAQARMGGLSSKPFSTGDMSLTGGFGASSPKPQQQGFGPMGGAPQGQGQAAATSPPDTKDEFLQKANKEVPGYHPHVSMAPMAPNLEVKTGSFIPMMLETSINSDLPGQITARVSEDVYDSISGCRLLIPAMAKVVGRYDSKIALGQGRMLVAWNSLIFPDGAELNLAGMQAYDTSGQAGLDSDVDNHYWRMFGLTFGLSMITTGVQLSVPQPNPTTGGAAAPQTPAQVLAVSLAQQYGTLGAQIISRYMAVQPTLRNFAGERFIVMVPRTIIFPKVWRNRCN